MTVHRDILACVNAPQSLPHVNLYITNFPDKPPANPLLHLMRKGYFSQPIPASYRLGINYHHCLL